MWQEFDEIIYSINGGFKYFDCSPLFFWMETVNPHLPGVCFKRMDVFLTGEKN